jgi:hypothetical protein
MQTGLAYVGARCTDSVALITAEGAVALRKAGIDGCGQYLGSVTAEGIQGILAAGLGFFPITYADRFNGPTTVAQLQLLNLPSGCTVWLDIESIGSGVPVQTLIQQINLWAVAVLNAGYMPGLYVGPGCLLTSLELYQLKVVRYWHSMSKIIDRNGQLAEPACGYCMYQLFPTQTVSGVNVDLNFVQQDWQGRLPVWVVASPPAPSLPEAPPTAA